MAYQMRRFEGRRVIVTGGSSGIGKATARRFAQEGARVLITSNNEAQLEEARAEMAADTGAEIHAFCMDVSFKDQCEATVACAIEKLGGIDVLINNAGIAWEEEFLEIPEEHWDKTIAVNLKGEFLMAQCVAREMVKQGSGAIVNMASTNGLVGEDKYAHYDASKGGVVQLTKTMAIELGKYGIRVNCVCPGYIVTPLALSIDTPEFIQDYVDTKIPLGRAGTPEDVAGVFAFLASDDAAFIHGAPIIVDGGQLTF